MWRLRCSPSRRVSGSRSRPIPLARPWFHSQFRFEGDAARPAVAARATSLRPPRAARPRTDPAWLALRLPPVHPGPLPGYLLIADRNNNRALVVSPDGKVVWADSALRGPDDAFFTPGWHSIITNEEFNDTLTQVSMRRQRVVWHYGHAGIAGSSPGYLNTPDDAYRLANGDTTVADIRNCRIVELSPRGTVVRILGGSCVHDPPRGFASPNGDTPLPDGGLLVTEIGGWIDRLDAHGRLRWSVRSPVSYPSDAQLLPNGRILVSAFTYPGRIVELTPVGEGDVVVRGLVRPQPARQAVARGAAPERADRRQRRLRRPCDPDRPPHPPHRLAVRTYRRRLVGARVPLEARRLDFLPARVVPSAPAPNRAVTAAGLGVTRVGSSPPRPPGSRPSRSAAVG